MHSLFISTPQVKPDYVESVSFTGTIKRKYGFSDTIWSMFKINFPNKKQSRRRNLDTLLQQLLGIQDYAAETHANEKKAHKRLLDRVRCSSFLYVR
jgi:hypothetical protein